MPHVVVDFERRALYDEVWREPLTKLAKRYGLSDVGLRKICVQLAIPLPERGYWAKLAAGKKLPQKPLRPTTGPTTHRFSQWVKPKDDELERRLAATAPTEAVATAVAKVELRATLDETLPLVRATAARLKKGYPDGRGWPAVGGDGFFGLAVSPESQTYALLLLDAAIRILQGAGYKLTAAKEMSKPAHFTVDGEALTMRLSERSRRTERELTKEEQLKKARDSYFYTGDRYAYHSTGDFKLDVELLESKYQTFTMSASKPRKLEDVLQELPARCAGLARETKVRRQLAEERRTAEQARQAEAHRKAEVRRKALERLSAVEKEADRWARAERLRAFVGAYEATGALDAEQRAFADWTLNAADWLDPLLRKRWPEVDDAPKSGYLGPADYP
ncbi:MAG: hypothetical protein WCK28_12320 [Burkholderiales bacterium]